VWPWSSEQAHVDELSAVRVSIYPGVVLPHIELWAVVRGADGQPDTYPYANIFPPSGTREELIEYGRTAKVHMFRAEPPREPGIAELMERTDGFRARLEYDLRRGIEPLGGALYAWSGHGWDIAAASSVLRHPSEAVKRLFCAPAWRPAEDELAWFRAGFAAQRARRRRPGGRA
jgi:hypothetical protein